MCALSKRDVSLTSDLSITAQLQSASATAHLAVKSMQRNSLNVNPGLSYEEVLNDDFQFDMDAHDVMVFLHIQKTGGTSFGKHLVRDLDLKVILRDKLRIPFLKTSYIFRDHASAKDSVNVAIAFVRIETKIGYFHVTRPVGGVDYMPIGRN